MTDLIARLLIALAIVLAVFATPRSGPEPTTDLPPADASRAEVGLSVQGPIGAPPRIGVPPSPSPTGTARPRPVSTSKPATAISSPAPRESARQNIPRSMPADYSPRPTAVHSQGQRQRGAASWYATGGPGFYAALPGYVDGTSVQVVVCAFPGGRSTCITVPVVTQCGCPGAAIVDLSVPAFRALGYPLSVGLVPVTLEVLG